MLTLEPTPSGWALLADRRQPVFAAKGRDSRRDCLAYASAHGVLCLKFDAGPGGPASERAAA